MVCGRYGRTLKPNQRNKPKLLSKMTMNTKNLWLEKDL